MVEVIELIVKEMKGLKDSVTEVELQRAKDQIKGNLILALESTNSRMQNIARQEIYFGRYFSSDEIIRDVDAVRIGQVSDVLERLISKDSIAITALGPVTEKDIHGITL